MGIGMLYFVLTKSLKNHMYKMHSTSCSSYQSICLIKVKARNNSNNDNNDNNNNINNK